MAGLCCCCTLQRGTGILALIDAILNGILLVILILGMVGAIALDPNDEKHDISKNEKITAIVVIAFAIVICTFQILLAVYLRKAAKARNHSALRVWLIVTCVIVIINVINYGLEYHSTAAIQGLISGIIGLLYKLYEIAVVYSFRNEILENPVTNAFHQVSQQLN